MLKNPLKKPGGGRLLLICAALVVGIALICIGSCSQNKADEKIGSTDTEARLEAKIKTLCERLDGVSEATVSVSLSDSGNGYAVFAGESAAYITGIVIVCRGGGDPKIQNELIAMLTAAYGVGANNIFIAEAEKSR